MKEIQDLPVSSMSAALRGHDAGGKCFGRFCRPGDNATITIRNPSFFVKDGQSTNPIYVIDDIIRTPDDFNALDAFEIDNISILKDAAAAVYGISAPMALLWCVPKEVKRCAQDQLYGFLRYC